ncbi:MAG: adenosine-specific kinase [Thaumarchaeota archaeon]|nr:adenosine-specific kinase [Nitrososphaerota archaeon]
MKTELVAFTPPDNTNVIIGQSHFIKTVEDVYEALVTASTNIKFGIGFCESSGKCLIRHDGNDPALEKLAAETAFKIAAGHTFVIILKDAYPINVLNRIKDVQEVATIYCATANPIQVVIVETDQGRAILGIIDGLKTKGIESEEDKQERKAFLRKIGYKL